MKVLSTLILLCAVNLCVNAQKKGDYSANSQWARINTKVFSSKLTKTDRLPSIVSNSSKAKMPVLIKDDFTTSKNPYGWRTTELNGVSYQREKGIYKISKANGLSDVITVIEPGCELDSIDFLLEAVIASKGESPPRAGLVWGYRDKDNYMAFKVNSKGEYGFIFMNSGENVEDSDFTPHRYVLKTLDNKLTVKKRGIKLIFYINDIQISEGDYGYMGSSRIGFIMSDSEAVFKEFKFQQLFN